MALKQLGSSLLAKNQPGSVTREQTETAIQGVPVPGKGEPGTLSRDLVQQPLEQKVSAGTDKVVRARPTVDETGGIPSEQITGQPTNLLPGSVGLNVPAGGVTNPIPQAAQEAAIAARAASQPASSPPSLDGGGQPAPSPAVLGTNTSSPVGIRSFQQNALPTILNRFGGRTIADAGSVLRSKINKSGKRSSGNFA